MPLAINEHRYSGWDWRVDETWTAMMKQMCVIESVLGRWHNVVKRTDILRSEEECLILDVDKEKLEIASAKIIVKTFLHVGRVFRALAERHTQRYNNNTKLYISPELQSLIEKAHPGSVQRAFFDIAREIFPPSPSQNRIEPRSSRFYLLDSLASRQDLWDAFWIPLLVRCHHHYPREQWPQTWLQLASCAEHGETKLAAAYAEAKGCWEAILPDLQILPALPGMSRPLVGRNEYRPADLFELFSITVRSHDAFISHSTSIPSESLPSMVCPMPFNRTLVSHNDTPSTEGQLANHCERVTQCLTELNRLSEAHLNGLWHIDEGTLKYTVFSALSLTATSAAASVLQTREPDDVQ